MLPFLKPKTVAGLIISTRKPDGSKTEEHSEDNEDEGLDACASDLIKAIHAKDIKAVSSALKAAFELVDSEPHEEGGEGSDYDDQNIKAAQGQE